MTAATDAARVAHGAWAARPTPCCSALRGALPNRRIGLYRPGGWTRQGGQHEANLLAAPVWRRVHFACHRLAPTGYSEAACHDQLSPPFRTPLRSAPSVASITSRLTRRCAGRLAELNVSSPCNTFPQLGRSAEKPPPPVTSTFRIKFYEMSTTAKLVPSAGRTTHNTGVLRYSRNDRR